MTPEERARNVWLDQVDRQMKGAPLNLEAEIAAAIRAAENDALERAALSVDAAFPGDYGGKRIRAMKHRN